MHILEYKYCPNCKEKLDKKKEYLECNSCKEKYYINPTPGVSICPVKNGKVLLCKRAEEPFKGEWATIGGFLNPEETFEQGTIRETKEETGLDVTNLRYLGSYPSTYGPPGTMPLINVYFIAEVKSETLKPGEEVSELKWFLIEETDKIKSSFKNVINSLKDLRKFYKKTRLDFEKPDDQFPTSDKSHPRNM